MRQITIALIIFFITVNAYAIDQLPQKGITLQKINTSDGQAIGSYRANYALLIGASDYNNNDWPDLNSVPGELDCVETALKSKHFIVERLPNPNAKHALFLFGTYLQEKVSQFVKQTPQYGKIQDYELSRGDFVFFIDTVNVVQVPSPTSPIPQQPATASLSVIPSAASTLLPKKISWYKNPWFWVGTVAATAGAAYVLQNNDDNPQGGIVLELGLYEVNHVT